MKIRYNISEKWDSATINMVMEAVEFAIDYYKLQDPKATLTVKMITGNPNEEEATASRIKNRRFELRLNRSRLQETNSILAATFHEMTHVKQFVFDGLRLYNSGKLGKWKGEMVESEDYWFSPWEMEARAMEEPLTVTFLEES